MTSLRADAAEHALRALELEQEAIGHCTSLSNPDYQRLMRKSVAEQGEASLLCKLLQQSDSYPYLALSRKTGAEYGDVLSYAGMLRIMDLCIDQSQVPVLPETYWQRAACERLTSDQKVEVIRLHEARLREERGS